MLERVHIVLTALILFLLIASLSSSVLKAGKPIVVATTSVLASIVRDLAGDKVIVEVISSPAICPAHYDVRPSDVGKVREANLIFSHGIEPWIEDLVRVSGSKAPIVTVKGPWNTPKFLSGKYVIVANALKKYLGIDVSERLKKCLKAINETAKWLRSYAEKNGFVGTPVVVMEWQKGFISFLGFNIVATYGPPEKVTPKLYEEVIENATKGKALLIIDNLQSGTELGRKIASKIGGVEVALTNFPETAPGLNNMTEVMKYNAQLIAQALYFAKLKNASIATKQLWVGVSKARHEAMLWRYAFIVSVIINAVLAAGIALLTTRIRSR